MRLAIASPFDPNKNLGRAYNLAMKGLEPGDWMCFKDLDCCLFDTNHMNLILGYIERYPDTGIFVCRTNRIHPLAKDQLYEERLSDDFNFKHHAYTADKLEFENTWTTTEINHEISGFLMVFSYDTWEEVGGFSENLKCLGVDNDFSLRVLNTKKILRMDSPFVWHGYRRHDVNNKEHLL